MAKKNRYSGVLLPREVGPGKPEVAVILIYDIEDDRLRTRASDICLDYGLDRIQFSAFFGKLNRNRRQELALKLKNEMGDESARIRMIPICEADAADMWVMEQYRQDAGEGKGEAGEKTAMPKLRVLKQGDR